MAANTHIIGPTDADCPDDGGKWALYCEHQQDGEWYIAGLIQDTNRRRLTQWRDAKLDDGGTVWCPECQADWTEHNDR